MKKNIDVSALGEALVDMIGTARGCAVEDSPGFVKAFGGAIANVAVGCSRLGAVSAFIGKVGEDPFGKFLKNFLEIAGAITDGMVFSATHNTSLVFVTLDENSKPSFYFFGKPSADLMLTPEEVNVDLIKRARFFHFGTVSLSAEPSRSATGFAVAAARKAGTLVSYDPNIRFHMWSDRDDAIDWSLRMMPQADIVKVNDDEAEWLTGSRMPETALKKLIGLGPKLAIVTLGKDGSYFMTAGAEGHIPGFRAEVVDTTGAGDAYVAAMLSGLAMSGAANPLADADAIRKALVRATAAAALTTEGVGAVSAMPDRDALDAALKGRFNVGA